MKRLAATILSIAALLGTVALSAQSMYALVDLNLKNAGGTTIGIITPGTKLAIESQTPGSANVTITGWQPKAAAGVIYENIDSQIALVRLTDSSGVNVVGSKADPYGATWNQVQVSGTVAANMLVTSVASIWSAGAQFYSQKCSQCHTLHQPSEFTANQWPGIVGSMAHNAQLSGSQEDLVVRYLQAHARTP